MDVLYVLTQGEGGIPHYTAALANAVSARADVSVMKPSSTSADELFDDAVERIEEFDNLNLSAPDLYTGNWNPIATLKSATSYRNVARIEDLDPDVVHFTAPAHMFPQVQLFTVRYGIDASYPVIETYHDILPDKLLRRGAELAPDEPFSNVVLHNLMKVGYRLLPTLDRAHAIVHTETNRDTLVYNGIDRANISVVPHGIYEIFTRYDHSDVSADSNTVLCFGQIVPTKAVEIVVRAIPHVAEHVEDVTCIIAGAGDLPPECRPVFEAYPDSFEIHNRFVPNEDVGRYFRRASVVILPHRRQNGHSGVLTIAYSYGKPVIASDVGDFPRLVAERGCGAVVAMDDPRTLADEIVTVLRDDERRAEMERNANAMRERFSWDVVAREHVDIYREVLDG